MSAKTDHLIVGLDGVRHVTNEWLLKQFRPAIEGLTEESAEVGEYLHPDEWLELIKDDIFQLVTRERAVNGLPTILQS